MYTQIYQVHFAGFESDQVCQACHQPVGAAKPLPGFPPTWCEVQGFRDWMPSAIHIRFRTCSKQLCEELQEPLSCAQPYRAAGTVYTRHDTEEDGASSQGVISCR